jgi:hypothetical protein
MRYRFVALFSIASLVSAQTPHAFLQSAVPTAAAGQVAAPVSVQTLTVPAGTAIPLTLINPLKKKSTKPGDAVRATVAFPIMAGMQVAIPAGSYVEGVVLQLTDRAPDIHQPEVAIHFTRLVFTSGYSVNLDAPHKLICSLRRRKAIYIGGIRTMWFLGMDVGTGGTRAVVVNAVGKLMGTASSAHAPFAPSIRDGRSRTPKTGGVRRRRRFAARIAATPEPKEPIAAIALTGQMHGAVMLDENGAVLRPSLIWCDTRTQPECDWLTERIGYERLIELTCNPALPNFTLTKLLWVKKHQPEIFAKIAHIMCPKDYVRYRLTGEFAIDVQEASGTLLLDVTHRRWSKEVAEAAGIKESWLPRVYESPEICARISAEAAGLTGLPAGTPVAAGAGDQGAGAVGMGILQPGSVSATIGTSGVVFAATAKPTKDPKGRLHTFCHAVPGLWHVMGVTQSAGLSLSWLKETFFAGQSYDA